MYFKLTVFFAFIVTVHCEILKNEITRIFQESNNCSGHDAAALNSVGIDTLCDIKATGFATPERILCNATKEAITNICHNYSTSFDLLFKPGVKFVNGSDFCAKQVTPIKGSLNISKYVSNFVNRLNAKECLRLCSAPGDELYLLCPFLVSYVRFLENVEVIPPKIDKPHDVQKPTARTVLAESVHGDTRSLGEQELQHDIKKAPENQPSVIINRPIDQTSSINNTEKSAGSLPTQPQSKLQNDEKKEKPLVDVPLNGDSVLSNSANNPKEEGMKEVVASLNDDGIPSAIEGDNNVPPVVIDDAKEDKFLTDDTEEGEKKTQPEDVPPVEKSDNSPAERAEPQSKIIKRPEFIPSPNPHFFAYFSFICALCIFFYVAMYNKKKVLALMIEGRRSNVKRRPNSAAYSKLDCNLEEAMTSGPSTSSSNTLLY